MSSKPGDLMLRPVQELIDGDVSYDVCVIYEMHDADIAHVIYAERNLVMFDRIDARFCLICDNLDV